MTQSHIEQTTLRDEPYHKIYNSGRIFWRSTDASEASPWLEQVISPSGGTTFFRVDDKPTNARLDKILREANKSA